MPDVGFQSVLATTRIPMMLRGRATVIVMLVAKGEIMLLKT